MRADDEVQVIILGAGLGSRLGRPLPKPLTRLEDGRTILDRQVQAVRTALGPQVPITVVVGFMAETVVREAPSGVRFVHNPAFASSNTARSLLTALDRTPPGGVLWLNGDVVLDPEVVERGRAQMAEGQTLVWVNTAAVGDEEIKYTLDGDGFVRELSKTVVGGLGEAVGVNYVGAGDRALLTDHLGRCAPQDYFERAIETAIARAGLRVRPLDISGLLAIEVDSEDDLARVNRAVTGTAVAAD
jgi:CDP-glycerol glycerophosphotransferase